MKNAKTEIWNWLDIMTARNEETEEHVSVIEHIIMENKDAEQDRERMMDYENRFGERSDTIKCNNFHIIEFPEEEKREKGTEGLFEEIAAENIPNLGKETDI